MGYVMVLFLIVLVVASGILPLAVAGLFESLFEDFHNHLLV